MDEKKEQNDDNLLLEKNKYSCTEKTEILNNNYKGFKTNDDITDIDKLSKTSITSIISTDDELNIKNQNNISMKFQNMIKTCKMMNLASNYWKRKFCLDKELNS